MDQSVEIDPEKMDGQFDASLNTLELKLQCQVCASAHTRSRNSPKLKPKATELTPQKLFSRFFQNVDDFPPALATCIEHLQNGIEEHFDDEEFATKLSGSFLFLRFVNAAIVAPEAYGRLSWWWWWLIFK